MKITSTFFHRLGELVDRIKPDLKNPASACAPAEDKFETPNYLSAPLADAAIGSLEENSRRVESLIGATSAPMDRQSKTAAEAAGLRIQVRDIAKQISTIKAMHEEGIKIQSEEIPALERALSKCEIAARRVQTEHIADSFRHCSPVVRAKIEALSVLHAILDGDYEFTKTVLRAHPLRNARHPLDTDHELLRRFDSHLLNRFAKMGLVIKVDYELCKDLHEEFRVELPELESAHQDVRQQCDELENKLGAYDGLHSEKSALITLLKVKESACLHIEDEIEIMKAQERELRESYYLRNNYYLVEDKYRGLFQHLTVLLDDAQVAVASSRSLEFSLMEKLFRGHFEMFCSFGVIERISSSELSELGRQKLCDVRDFQKMGKSYCRFSTTGLEQLRGAISLRPPQCPPKPICVAQPVEPKAQVQQPRVRDYAIVKLDDSVEFY